MVCSDDTASPARLTEMASNDQTTGGGRSGSSRGRRFACEGVVDMLRVGGN